MSNIKEKIEELKRNQPEMVEKGKKVVEELVKQYPFLKQPELMTKLLYTYVKYGNGLLEEVQRPLELKPNIASETMKLMWINGVVDSYIRKEGMLKNAVVIYVGPLNETKSVDLNGEKKKIRNFTALIDNKLYTIIVSGSQVEKYKVKSGVTYEMSLVKSESGAFYAVDDGICRVAENQLAIDVNTLAELVLEQYPKLRFPFDTAVLNKKDYAVLGMINILNPKFALLKFIEDNGMEYVLGMPNPPSYLKDGAPVIVVGNIIRSATNATGQQIQVDYIMLPKIVVDLAPVQPNISPTPSSSSTTSDAELSKEDIEKIFGGSDGA